MRVNDCERWTALQLGTVQQLAASESVEQSRTEQEREALDETEGQAFTGSESTRGGRGKGVGRDIV